ncbi:MAG TPA: hypothetical protein VFK35_02800 [Candidatus Limnocylindrales bacterium]|nr:hypothetical protein [Candidatus Limnocylindrales bacterium]
MDAIGLWWITLGVAALVVVVVAALLVWIARAAERIDAHALEIWGAGKNIAANTVQIWHLHKTNETATEILTTAQAIAGVAGSIDDRLARLPAALRGDDR